jgi:hypothetical protein
MKSAAEDSGSRIDTAELKAAILKALQGKAFTHAEIKASPEVVQVYKAVGKEVPNLFAKLDKLGETKKGLMKSSPRRRSGGQDLGHESEEPLTPGIL